MSFATYQARFQDDEKQPARRSARRRKRALFTYRNPGEDINQAVSINAPALLVAAERVQIPHRVQPVLRLTRPTGQTWSEALKSVDDKAAVEQQGDIIVTEESAKRMQQRVHIKGTCTAAPRRAAPAGTPPHQREQRRLRPITAPPRQGQDPHRGPDLHPRRSSSAL